MANSNIAINYKHIAHIDTSGAALSGTWAELGEGFDNIKEALNEVVENFSWLNAGGWGGSRVVGGQLKFSLSGKRVFGNDAQDYIYGDAVKYAFGAARDTQIRISRVDPSTDTVVGTIICPCTLVKIDDSLGKSQEGSAISVDIDCNGAPTITLGFGTNQELTVVSLVGTTTAGNSTLYINPALSANSGFVYRLSDVMPAYNEVCAAGSNGWVALTANTANNVSGAVSGQIVTVVEKLTSGNYARKVGQATLTAYSA